MILGILGGTVESAHKLLQSANRDPAARLRSALALKIRAHEVVAAVKGGAIVVTLRRVDNLGVNVAGRPDHLKPLRIIEVHRIVDPLAELAGNALDFPLAARNDPVFFGDLEVFVVSGRIRPNKSSFWASEGHALARPRPGSIVFLRA
jgi:hypothetical protein